MHGSDTSNNWPREGATARPARNGALPFSAEVPTATAVRAPVGEVIESSTTDFLAQACQLDVAPAFGTFVQAGADQGITIYGVVGHVETNGIDPSARPIMRGHDDVRDQQIYVENPDLPHVLRTTFRAVIVGFAVGANGEYNQYLPPRPPRLHFSVHTTSEAEVRGFTASGLLYLQTLLNAANMPTEEMVAANVRLVDQVVGDAAHRFTRQAGRELAQQLRSDYARFNNILRRMVVAR